MSDEWLEEASEIAAQVARTAHRKYHTYFDVADVKQELVMWCIGRPDKVQEWLNHEQTVESRHGGIKQLAKTLSRHADRYCRKRKAQSVGYELRDEVYYSPALLTELLPHVWSDVAPTSDASKPRVSGGGGVAAEGGNYVASLFDVRAGLEKIQPDDRIILQYKFFEGLSYSALASVLGISDSTAHRKVSGALRRLCKELGGENPFANKNRRARDTDA
jgi:DNA-directed RNA polymerase specialized sigma24 family protein